MTLNLRSKKKLDEARSDFRKHKESMRVVSTGARMWRMFRRGASCFMVWVLGILIGLSACIAVICFVFPNSIMTVNMVLGLSQGEGTTFDALIFLGGSSIILGILYAVLLLWIIRKLRHGMSQFYHWAAGDAKEEE